jgi:hypothetical protein
MRCDWTEASPGGELAADPRQFLTLRHEPEKTGLSRFGGSLWIATPRRKQSKNKIMPPSA